MQSKIIVLPQYTVTSHYLFIVVSYVRLKTTLPISAWKMQRNLKLKALKSMYIKQLTLKNFRSFIDLSISFVDEDRSDQPCRTMVFIGNNGAGKTAILDALKTNLSWLVARINRDKGTGFHITDRDVQNDQTFADISLQLQYQESSYNWRLAKTLKGRLKITDSQLESQ